jgi:uncharacterized protein YqeY
MTTLMERIRADQLQARKAKDETAIGLLTALKGEADRVGKDAGNRETTEEEAIAMVQKFLKNARETMGLAPSDKIAAEIKILEAYLPQQMSQDELREVVLVIRRENPSANMGIVMKHLKDNYGGRYDGKVASQVVKDALV